MGFAAFSPGEVIFHQGDSGDHFYIILSGAVDVAVDEGNQVLLCCPTSLNLESITHARPVLLTNHFAGMFDIAP